MREPVSSNQGRQSQQQPYSPRPQAKFPSMGIESRHQSHTLEEGGSWDEENPRVAASSNQGRQFQQPYPPISQAKHPSMGMEYRQQHRGMQPMQHAARPQAPRMTARPSIEEEEISQEISQEEITEQVRRNRYSSLQPRYFSSSPQQPHIRPQPSPQGSDGDSLLLQNRRLKERRSNLLISTQLQRRTSPQTAYMMYSTGPIAPPTSTLRGAQSAPERDRFSSTDVDSGSRDLTRTETVTPVATDSGTGTPVGKRRDLGIDQV